MEKEINFDKLKNPFDPEELEWRLQQCDTDSSGRVWGFCLAYVTNRAIQNRLDEVVGAENWKNEFLKAPDGGVLCGISIRYNGEWITKYDGAENTNIEAVKGGLSDSMKRSAVQWGIGRYLYSLESNKIEVTDKGKYFGKTKSGAKFRWNPPKLPEWALPKVDIQELTVQLEQNLSAGIIPESKEATVKKAIEENDVSTMLTIINWCSKQNSK